MSAAERAWKFAPMGFFSVRFLSFLKSVRSVPVRKIREYIKAMFYSEGKPYPVYGYIFILMTLIVGMLVLRIFQRGSFSDSLILGMCSFVAVWSGIVSAKQTFKK